MKWCSSPSSMWYAVRPAPSHGIWNLLLILVLLQKRAVQKRQGGRQRCLPLTKIHLRWEFSLSGTGVIIEESTIVSESELIESLLNLRPVEGHITHFFPNMTQPFTRNLTTTQYPRTLYYYSLVHWVSKNCTLPILAGFGVVVSHPPPSPLSSI